MKPVTDVITFVENKETTQNANPSTSISALLAYQCNNNQASQKGVTGGPHKIHALSLSVINKSRTANCPDCKKVFHISSKKSRGWNPKDHTHCDSC